MLHVQIDIILMLWIAKGFDFVQCVKVHKGTDMSKYTARQIAESDELFEKQIHKVRKFYLSRNPDKMMMLEERKVVVKERNKGLSPEYDKEYYCGTCGAKDGAEHPKSGYCFHCDTDNWISKNN